MPLHMLLLIICLKALNKYEKSRVSKLTCCYSCAASAKVVRKQCITQGMCSNSLPYSLNLEEFVRVIKVGVSLDLRDEALEGEASSMLLQS